MADVKYAKEKIARMANSFIRYNPNAKQAVLISDTVDDARLYRLGYCQDGQELEDDYYQYVYENSFARRRRRNRD